MERLTRREPFWLGEEFWTSAMEPDDEEIDVVYEKLKHYEDLEERLEKVYGEHERMLETIVSHLEKHEGIDVGNPGKALLLTDDDVDKWNEYSKIGTVEQVREAVEKTKEKKVIRNPWQPCECPTCNKELSESVGDGYYKHYYYLKRCPECGQKIDWSMEE